MFNLDFISKINSKLDELEATDGEAVLVTVATGSKVFSSGFDLKYWAKNPSHPILSMQAYQKLLIRFLTLSVPTFCVWQGHAIAGGVFLGMAHDYIIMKDDPNLMVCLNEL